MGPWKKDRRTEKWKTGRWRHTEKHMKGPGHEPREIAVGHRRGREGQEGEMGTRSASVRYPPSPLLSLHLHQVGHLLCGQPEVGAGAAAPYTESPPSKGSHVPGPPPLWAPTSSWQGWAGVWGRGPRDRLTREPQASGGNGPCGDWVLDTELIHRILPFPKSHCPRSLLPGISLKKWEGMPPTPSSH